MLIFSRAAKRSCHPRVQTARSSCLLTHTISQHVLSRLSSVFGLLMLCVLSIGPVQAQSDVSALEKHAIIGGQEIAREAYPWMAALTYNVDADLFNRQFCGGSVIADTWVLTAAHCLFDQRGDLLSTSDLKVAINAVDLRDEQVATEIVVANVYIHPEYDHAANNPHSDIALLELATPTGVTPITLSTKASSKLIGLQATVIGWGATDNSDPSRPKFPDWSHSVDVPIVSLEICNGPQSYMDAIYPNQLCAGYAEGQRDSCVGDSGGPLITTYEGVEQQVGVVSFGYGCALPNFYGIYTDVPYFIGWINQFVYVGEPEFEPEQIIPRTQNATNGISTVSDSSGGAASWFVMLLLGLGALLRRRWA